MLVVPGEWSSTTVQFLAPSSNDESEKSFYKKVVSSSPFRGLSNDWIEHAMGKGRTLKLYRHLLPFSATRLLNVNSLVHYNQTTTKNAYDAAMGLVPRLTHLVTHAACKINHRSICLNKQLFDRLKVDDETAENMVSDF